MRFGFILLLMLTSCAIAPASDWPQWRGPNRDGLSPEKGLLTRWPEGGPRLLFEAQGVGRGYSSMACAAGKLYTVGDTLSTESDSKEYLICLDGMENEARRPL
jgi:outer membrane protein assembly factor BamB